MSETSETDGTPDAEGDALPRTEVVHSVTNRVLNLSIFFVGVGVFAAAGVAMARADLFVAYRVTYFAVGVVVGVVGLLLWLVTQ